LLRTWEAGLQVRKFIGFDATEDHRVKGGGTYAVGKFNICAREGLPDYKDRYQVEYPLRDWGMDREACIRLILDQGLPVPPKSACFFCPAAKPFEIAALKRDDPESYALAIEMERLYRDGHHFRGDNVWTVKAKHKVTGEKVELDVTGTSAAEARAAFRNHYKDTKRPYQWDVSPSPAVPGLGRSFRWEELVMQA
jgi:hypothetical protein